MRHGRTQVSSESAIERSAGGAAGIALWSSDLRAQSRIDRPVNRMHGTLAMDKKITMGRLDVDTIAMVLVCLSLRKAPRTGRAGSVRRKNR